MSDLDWEEVGLLARLSTEDGSIPSRHRDLPKGHAVRLEPHADGCSGRRHLLSEHVVSLPRWAPAAIAMMALFLAAAVLFRASGTALQWAQLRGATEMGDLSFCSRTEEDIEYHTQAVLRSLADVVSATVCCAECDADPRCGAWVYRKRAPGASLQSLAGMGGSNCYLQTLRAGEEPLRIRRSGVTSGMPSRQVKKHGVEASLLVKDGSPSPWDQASEGPKPWHFARLDRQIESNETCPGQVVVTGVGKVSLVAAQWHKPDQRASPVAVQSGGIVPRFQARAYFAERCRPDYYNHADYASLKLLGKSFRYRTYLSGAGCGCDAQVLLLPMPRNQWRSHCNDYICGAAGDPRVCGVPCAQISVQDANQYAWASSLHANGDAEGVGAGYGGRGENTSRLTWTSTQYSPGGECIDTTWPFDVEVSFPLDEHGHLKAMDLRLSQEGRRCSLTARISDYVLDGTDRLAELSAVLEAGVTPVVAYSGSTQLLWMDGMGSDALGPCVQDMPQACPESVRFDNFMVGPLESLAAVSPNPSSLMDVALSALDPPSEIVHRFKEDQHEGIQLAAAREALVKSVLSPADCGVRCNVSGVGVGNHTYANVVPETVHEVAETELFQQEIKGQLEWQVVDKQAEVHAGKSTSSEVLGILSEGAVLAGREEAGNWLRQLPGPGYVERLALRQRIVSYKEIGSGTCTENGMHPIIDTSICTVAGYALGYYDTTVSMEPNETECPEGCYLKDGRLWMSTGAASRGKGVIGTRQPICSSSPYNASTRVAPPRKTTTLALTTSKTTTWTTSTSVAPMLFCFMVLDTGGPELQLVREQIHQGVGIFACDEFAVFSEVGDFSLGRLPKGWSVDVTTTWFQKADVWYSPKKNRVDALLYMNVWEAVRNDGRYRHHDWVIKVDPSTVVLPWRLRERLASRVNQNCYILGCDQKPGAYPSHVMLGPLEVYSQKAVAVFMEGVGPRCKSELHWNNWGEAEFMSRCMDLLGASGVDDAGLLSDKSCNVGRNPNCQDRSSGAYHGSWSVPEWFDCWGQATLL